MPGDRPAPNLHRHDRRCSLQKRYLTEDRARRFHAVCMAEPIKSLPADRDNPTRHPLFL
jgi:hypothetical protein